MNIVLNEATHGQLNAYLKKPSHAVLLVGAKGSGKRTVANHLILETFGVREVSDFPYGKILSPIDGKSTGIEAVRELEHFLALKVPNENEFNRFIIFEDAHTLTPEAQNALLKTLEEPPKGSVIVMTSAFEQAMLPTIRSRVQTIKVNKPAIGHLERHFSELGYNMEDIRRANSISGGLPGLMTDLLSGQEHPLTAATNYARQLLSKTSYEKLLLVDELAKNKTLCLDICFILQQMSHISLQKASGPAIKKWQSILEASYAATDQLQRSAQPKLVLDNLMLHL